MDKSEWEEELKQDAASEAHEAMQEARHQWNMHQGEDYFYEHTQEVRQVALDAIQDLINVYKEFAVEFDIKDVMDEL